jgi:L-lactate dehydrogenase complex protein LldG
MSLRVSNNTARDAIMQSIRANLAGSERFSSVEHDENFGQMHGSAVSDNGHAVAADTSAVAMFRERAESVGVHCTVAQNEHEAGRALNAIVNDLRRSSKANRIAVSDAPLLAELTRGITELEICPSPTDLFGYDVGITSAQRAIAETGTLILELEQERHRLISLLPPIHVALVRSSDICLTIADALKQLRGDGQRAMSRAITFITGPSRTADIELTLTVGVHGPKELYVIVIDDAG